MKVANTKNFNVNVNASVTQKNPQVKAGLEVIYALAELTDTQLPKVMKKIDAGKNSRSLVPAKRRKKRGGRIVSAFGHLVNAITYMGGK